jgi:hypothetical protein
MDMIPTANRGRIIIAVVCYTLIKPMGGAEGGKDYDDSERSSLRFVSGLGTRLMVTFR